MPHIQLNAPRRNRLPHRRASTTFSFECNSLAYSATVSHYPNGDLAEIFIRTAKPDLTPICCQGCAVVCSIALQHGIPVDVIRKALLRIDG